jgi:dihydrodipicolinate synthase/N-acetylneuraminate lyase
VTYTRADAKSHARARMRGIWAAALMPFRADGRMDEDGFAASIEHWITDRGIAGLFIAGKQGEFFSMSPEERKRCFDRAVEACAGPAAVAQRPPEKPHARQKYRQFLLGQTGGCVRPPCLELTEAGKAETRAAFAACGLQL